VFQVRRLKGRINLSKCPANSEVPVQVAFYQSKRGFVGTDTVTYEVTSSTGDKNTYTVAITVTASPKGPSGLQEL
jgi:hypothetical protein